MLMLLWPTAALGLLLTPSLVDFDVARKSPVKRLPGFLTQADIEQLRQTARTVRDLKGTHASVATRDRQLREGGRTVHMNHHLRLLMPELHDRMLSAARAADAELWCGADVSRPELGVLQDRAMVELRSAEYHDVRGVSEGALPMHLHGDHGSLVTVDLMLSDSSEFEGGTFQTETAEGELIDHCFEKGDALLFLSHKHHGVAPVTAGRRNIVVCEFWEGLARRCPQRCDQHWQPCHCKYKASSAYAMRSPETAACPWPADGPSDSELLRLRGLEVHRARVAAEAREAAEQSAARREEPRPPLASPRSDATPNDADDAAGDDAGDDGTAASGLRRRGYAVLAEPVVAPDLVEEAAALSGATLRRLLDRVEASGCDPLEQQYLFSEICHRQRGRWDLCLGGDADGADADAEQQAEATWTRLADAAVAAAAPIIAEAQAQEQRAGGGDGGDGGGDGGDEPPRLEVVQRGVVISRPGARVQRLHVDATHSHFEAAKASASHRLYSVFVPLVDIERDGDGTEFWPTGDLHSSTRALARHIISDPDESPLDPDTLDAPACRAGGAIVFDYRAIHRGLPNEGERERAVAYVVVSTGGATDAHNFPAQSLRDAPEGAAADFAFWNAPGSAQAKDDLDYYTEIEGDPFAIPK